MINKVNTVKRDRFLRLAEKRTVKLLRAVTVLSHCSNRSLYEYRAEEVEKIFNAIEKSVTEARMKFKGNEPVSFTL